jgi:hypothetical protein
LTFPRHVFVFDLMICLAFAVPGLAGFVCEQLAILNATFSLPGEAAGIAGGALFFVHFAGLLGVVLNLALLDSNQITLHRTNVLARGFVIALLLDAVIRLGLPTIYLIFAATEIVGGMLTLVWLRSHGHSPASSRAK